MNIKTIQDKCIQICNKLNKIEENYNNDICNEQELRLSYIETDLDKILESINDLEVSFLKYKDNENISDEMQQEIHNEKIVNKVVNSFTPIILAYSNSIK